MKGGGEHPLTVVVRIRPLNEAELVSGGTQVALKVDDQMAVLADPSDDPDDILRANRSREKRYLFHHVFDASSSQEEVYQATTRFLIDSVIGGYNGTVFAYGATGAGKTYTMLGTEWDPGIYVRALNDLFTLVQQKQEETLHQVSMSYLEIYNEMIRDLLNPASGYLEMREDAKGGVQVSGLSEISTASTAEIMELLQRGNHERTQEPTKANKTSSRSHAVLQVTVKQRSRGTASRATAATAVTSVQDQLRVGRLFLVDLAGSERAANTQNRGKRMVEGAHINRSLLALGNCINALSEMKGGATYKYVNYRDSKLTRLLKEALGGNCRTVMIAHVGPASMHFEESRNTLLYADRAKHIKNRVRRNVEDVSYHLSQYTAIISELKEEISRLKIKLATATPSWPTPSIQAIQSEVMRTTNGHEFFKLKEQLLLTFKEQLDLRRSLMELNTSSTELGQEVNRHQLTVTEWEIECANAKQRRESGEGHGDDELDKRLEMSGASYEDDEPDEVRVARDELPVLASERRRLEKQRTSVTKELAIAKQKAAMLEENLPKYISSEEQREMVTLLLRVHELEIDKTEIQSELYMKENEISRKESIIILYQNRKSIADEIIAQQKELIREHNVALPRELEDVYEAYADANAAAEHASDSLVSMRPPLPIANNLPSLTELSAAGLQAASSERAQKGNGGAAAARTREYRLNSQTLWEGAAAEEQQRLGRRHHSLGRRVQPTGATASGQQLALPSQHQRHGADVQGPRQGDIALQRSSRLPVSKADVSAAKHSNLALPAPSYTLLKEKTLYSISIRSSSAESAAAMASIDKGRANEMGRVHNGGTTPAEDGTRSIAALAAAKRRRQQEQLLGQLDRHGNQASGDELPVRPPLLSVSDGYLNRTFVSVASGGNISVATLDVQADSAVLSSEAASLTASVLAEHDRRYAPAPAKRPEHEEPRDVRLMAPAAAGSWAMPAATTGAEAANRGSRWRGEADIKRGASKPGYNKHLGTTQQSYNVRRHRHAVNSKGREEDSKRHSPSRLAKTTRRSNPTMGAQAGSSAIKLVISQPPIDVRQIKQHPRHGKVRQINRLTAPTYAVKGRMQI